MVRDIPLSGYYLAAKHLGELVALRAHPGENPGFTDWFASDLRLF
jgi:hypothetical protein